MKTKQDDESNSKPVCISMPQTLHEFAKKAASDESRSLSNWVCLAIEEKLLQLSKDPTLFDRFAKNG